MELLPQRLQVNAARHIAAHKHALSLNRQRDDRSSAANINGLTTHDAEMVEPNTNATVVTAHTLVGVVCALSQHNP